MNLFNNYNEIEKGLLEHYYQLFTTMGLPFARSTAKKMLDKVIKESKADRTYYLPSNFGGIILREEKGNEKQELLADVIRKYLEKKRADGVTDEDIRWWWNLNDIERRMMHATDEFSRLALFIKYVKEDGLSDIEAMKRVRKFHPIYGDADDTSYTSGDDTPLPEELKNRVNVWIQKKSKEPEKFKTDLDLSTINALIRKEIRAGNL